MYNENVMYGRIPCDIVGFGGVGRRGVGASSGVGYGRLGKG